jgi:hypothetical protein
MDVPKRRRGIVMTPVGPRQAGLGQGSTTNYAQELARVKIKERQMKVWGSR